MKLRYIVILTVVVVTGVVGYFAYTVHRYASTTVPNMYAVEWVGGMVVDYLRQHGDRWPGSWGDLRPVYDQHVAKVGQAWTFEELKSRVTIRWDIDVEEVRGCTDPPVGLIVLSDGGDEHWSGYEPNAMVHSYLTQRDPANQPVQLTGDAGE